MKDYRKPLKDALEALLCSKEEIEIYLTLFISNGLKVSQISERTNLQRTMIYGILENMSVKNLVYQDLTCKPAIFYAVDLNEISNKMNEKFKLFKNVKSIFDESLDKINEIKIGSRHAPKVQVYTKKQVSKVVDEIISKYSFSSFFDPHYFGKNHPELLKEHLIRIKNTKQTIKELISSENQKLKSFILRNKTKNYQVKQFPTNVDFPSDLIIYDNKVFIGNYISEVAIVISDQKIHDSFLNLHNFLWEISS